MPHLVDIEAVKARLEIPRDETSFNLEVRESARAAKARVIEATGLDLDGPTSEVVDIFERTRTNTVIQLTRRPVNEITSVRRRHNASSSSVASAWQDAEYDLLDRSGGKLMVLGAGATWPPQHSPSVRVRRDRIDVLEVTYSTLAAPVPEDLAAAIADLAAHIFRQGRTSGLSSQSMGGVSQSYLPDAIPPSVAAALARFRPRRASAWV